MTTLLSPSNSPSPQDSPQVETALSALMLLLQMTSEDKSQSLTLMLNCRPPLPLLKLILMRDLPVFISHTIEVWMDVVVPGRHVDRGRGDNTKQDREAVVLQRNGKTQNPA